VREKRNKNCRQARASRNRTNDQRPPKGPSQPQKPQLRLKNLSWWSPSALRANNDSSVCSVSAGHPGRKTARVLAQWSSCSPPSITANTPAISAASPHTPRESNINSTVGAPQMEAQNTTNGKIMQKADRPLTVGRTVSSLTAHQPPAQRSCTCKPSAAGCLCSLRKKIICRTAVRSRAEAPPGTLATTAAGDSAPMTAQCTKSNCRTPPPGAEPQQHQANKHRSLPRARLGTQVVPDARPLPRTEKAINHRHVQ
jgi:hypothetical protein